MCLIIQFIQSVQTKTFSKVIVSQDSVSLFLTSETGDHAKGHVH